MGSRVELVAARNLHYNHYKSPSLSLMSRYVGLRRPLNTPSVTWFGAQTSLEGSWDLVRL